MPGPMMMPQQQPQLSVEKQKIVNEYAKKVMETLKGLEIGDMQFVFREVMLLINEKKI